MKIEFNRATMHDVEGIISLCNECFSERTDTGYARRVFAETKSDPNQIYVNGVLDGVIIAHAKVTVIPTMYEEMGTYAIINHFCVKEEYRRKHIATDLLNAVVDICKGMGCKRMCLWSKNFRVGAHAFYKKYGFELLEAGFFQKDL